MNISSKHYRLFLFIIVVLSIYPLFKVGLIINDDLQNSIKVFKMDYLDYLRTNFEAWKTQGRTNFLAIIWYSIPFLFDNFLYYKLVNLILMLSNFTLLAYLFSKVFKSKIIIYLTILISFVGLQNSWEHNPITSFPGFFNIPILFLLISLILFLEYLNKKKNWLIYLSVFFYALTLFSYELFILYLPIFVLIFWIMNPSKQEVFKKENIKPVILFASITIIYLLIYFTFRFIYGGSYDGAKFGSINIVDSLKVIWQFSVSSIPSYFFFNDKYQYLMYMYSDLKEIDLENVISFFVKSISLLSIVKAVLVFYLFNGLMNLSSEHIISAKKLSFGIAIGTFYFFVPSVLLSVTPLYQKTVIEYNQIGMPASFFSYLSAVFVFTIFCLLIKSISNIKWRKILTFIVGIVLVFFSLTVDFTNYYVGKYQAMSSEKWVVVNEFLETSEFQSLPGGATIYAPSLWSQIGSVSFHDSYWTDYFTYKSKKSITVANDLNGIDNFEDTYFLEYSQALKDSEEYLVFGKLDSYDEEKILLSSYISVFNHSKYNDYYIIGSVGGGSNNSVYLNNGDVIDTDSIFGYKIDHSNMIKEGALKKSIITGTNIDIDSIFITNGTNNQILLPNVVESVK